MRSLDPPSIDYRALYRQAIVQTQRNADRAVLSAMEDRMVSAALAYDRCMRAHGPYAVTPIPLSVQEDELARDLYDKRIVSMSGVCRSTYNDLLISATSCPFCIDGEIYEIDHFLPQHQYHDVVMYPGNLVPICHPCNHTKLGLLPVDARHSLLHPYFDRLPDEPWLIAQLDWKAGGPVLNYRVELDESRHGNIAPRLKYHFITLELDRRMRLRSAKVLVELQSDIETFLDLLGPDALRAHFVSEAAKHYGRHGNTLEAAAYLAASLNDEFCAGAYRS